MYQLSDTLASMSTTSVSDDVWNSLDRDAARPVRRTRRILAAIAAVATLAAVVVTFGFISGLLRPRVWLEMTGPMKLNPSAHTFLYTFSLHNDGWIDEKLTAVTATDPAVHTRLSYQAVAFRDDKTFITVHATVDCAHVRPLEPRFRLSFDRTWGTITRTVDAVPSYPLGARGYDQIFMEGTPSYVCDGGTD